MVAALYALSLFLVQSEGDESIGNPARKSCWFRPWIRRRQQYGICHALLAELAIEDPARYMIMLLLKN